MELNVSQLLMEPSGSCREYELDDPLAMDGISEELIIRGAVKLMRTNKSIWVSADLRSDLECQCGRCLELYRHPVQFQLEEEYIPILNPLTGARVSPPRDGSDYYLIDENHILDLAPPVREYIIIADPMKPLCSQECAGLCADCGADLNHFRCDCEAVPDQRWAPLLQLISDHADDD